MSGRKCSDVTISQDSYEMMLEDAARADDAIYAAELRAEEERERNRRMCADMERRQEELRNEYRAGLQDLSSEMKDLEMRQADRIEEIRIQTAEDIATLEQNTNSRIEQQGVRFQDALQRQGVQFQDALDQQGTRFNDALKRQGQRLQNALATHRAEVSEALQDIQDDIQADRAHHSEAAHSRIQDLETLFQLMREQRAHERFAPGELDVLEGKLSYCRDDLASGHSQSAIQGARERYFEYQELQLRIAERQAEWDAYLAEVQRLTENTAGAVAAAEGATYSFSDSNSTQEVEAQVDYWSEGALTDFRNRLKEHMDRLGSPESIDTDDLKQMLKDLAPMENELSDIVANAKERLVQSQVRQNIGASILASFEGTDWELNESTYESQDFRKGLHLKLKNQVDEEIIASITPVATQEGGVAANVEINFFDRYNNEGMRMDRLKEMQGRMQEEGVSVGGFECLDQSEGQPGNANMRDFERLRASSTSTASV